MPALICFAILLISHLTVDDDFPKEVKQTAGVIFAIVCLIYLIFGLIF